MTDVRSVPPTTHALDDAHTYALAHWGKRATARLIDYAIVVVAGVVFWLGCTAFGYRLLADEGEPTPVLLSLGFVVYLVWALLQVVWQGRRGVTVGKRVLGLRVVGVKDAGVIGVPRAFLRAGVKWLAVVGFVTWFVNGLWPLWDARRQAISDKVVKAVVIDLGKRR